eukprot:EG_transcript_59503
MLYAMPGAPMFMPPDYGQAQLALQEQLQQQARLRQLQQRAAQGWAELEAKEQFDGLNAWCFTFTLHLVFRPKCCHIDFKKYGEVAGGSPRVRYKEGVHGLGGG